MLLRTTEAGPRVTELDVKRIERELGLQFPTDYRRFLVEFNGGRPEPAGFEISDDAHVEPWRIHFFFAVNDEVESNRLDWAYRVTRDTRPGGVFPIARDPFGNFLYLAESPRDGVFFGPTPPDSGNVQLHKVANDFSAFLTMLK